MIMEREEGLRGKDRKRKFLEDDNPVRNAKRQGPISNGLLKTLIFVIY